MSFSNPLGFLGLLAIPVLILIYIIKNRYTEQTISSTYIWDLSERFLKRRVPISKLAGILSLILQILAVIFISFAIAHPVLIIGNSANSYCFVLDGSGSMNIVQNGKTRFDTAKKEIYKIIDGSKNGSSYTLIFAGSSTDFVFEELTDKKTAKQIIGELSAGYGSGWEADALNSAQEFFDYNPSVLTYLFTDKTFVQTDNIEVIDVSDAVENYAVTGVAYELSGSQLKVFGKALSYASQSELTVELYFDGEETPYASKKVLADNAGTDFEFLCDKAGFGSFRVAVAEEDALALDNEAVVYDVAYQNISDILLVSESPFFMRAALASAGINKLDFITTDEYENNTGYGLYIFDSFMPETLPDDGAVWFINPKSSLAGTNFSFQSEVEPRSEATYSTSTETTVRKLLSGIVDPKDKTGKSFQLKSYVKCGLNGRFTTLASCDNNPILFVGSNAYGNREAVFSFDIHDSAQFALLGDLPTLVKNLIDYSFPTVIDGTSYFCGDTVQINIISGCTNIRIETPNGNTAYPDASSAVSEYKLTEVGVYTIVLVMKDKSERVLNVFAGLPEEEREPLKLESGFSIVGTPENNKSDGFIDTLLYLFIVLAVLTVADYGLYCYEQYQLR